MLIRSLRVRNFRSCLDVEVGIESLTAIVGANGCGKSTVLRALDLFYSPTPRFDAGDFYNGDTREDIEISVTFDALSDDDRERFARYLQKPQAICIAGNTQQKMERGPTGAYPYASTPRPSAAKASLYRAARVARRINTTNSTLPGHSRYSSGAYAWKRGHLSEDHCSRHPDPNYPE